MQIAENFRAFLACFALGGQRVGGFAGLADGDRQAFFARRSDRDNEIRCRSPLQPGMCASLSIMNLPASAACQLVPQAMILTSWKFSKFLFGDVHLIEEDFSGFLRDSSEQGVAHGARLLENFLLHEMFEAALFGHDRVPGDVLNGAVDRVAFEIHQTDALRREHGYFAIAEEEDVSRVLQNRGNVAGDKEFVFAQAYDDRRTEARGDDLQWIARGKRNQRVSSAHHFHGFQNGFFQRRVL